MDRVFFRIALLVLFVSTLALAQAGKHGGSDGIYQYNAYTLGKWGVVAGGSGFGTFDSYAYSGNRHYHVSDNDNIGITGGTGDYKVGMFAPSLELVPYFGVGTSKFLDIGGYLPYYGDLAASVGALLGEPNGAGEAELWASGFGDLAIWTKIRTELFPEDFLFAAAFYFEMDFPTGEEGYGMRVRHPWYYNTQGGYTDPFTAGDIVTIPMLIGTFDFKKKGYAPLRWNLYFGGAIASGYGANSLIYGTGLNFIPDKLFDSQPDNLGIRLFAEFHAESRMQKTNLPRMPLDLDVMTTDGGITFDFEDLLEVTLAFEFSIKAMAYLLLDYNRDSSHGYKNEHESGYYGERVTSTYAISATPYYGAHLNVSIHFGGVKDPPPEPCPEPKVDTVFVTRVDTVTVEIAATCPVYEEKVCPLPELNYFKKNIHFKSDSYELEDRSKYVLDELVDLLKTLPYVNLEIEGHTDSVASDSYNEVLSQNRANAAIKYLVDNGIDSTRLRAAWHGEGKPIEDNGSKDGRRKNRRVELVPFNGETDIKAEEKDDGSGSDLYEYPDSTKADSVTQETPAEVAPVEDTSETSEEPLPENAPETDAVSSTEPSESENSEESQEAPSVEQSSNEVESVENPTEIRNDSPAEGLVE